MSPELFAPVLASPYAAAALVVAGFAPFGWRRLLTYLHIFQQEEYDGPRFLRWLWRERAFDRRLSLALVTLFVLELILAGWVPRWVFVALIGLCCLGAAAIERDP